MAEDINTAFSNVTPYSLVDMYLCQFLRKGIKVGGARETWYAILQGEDRDQGTFPLSHHFITNWLASLSW